jgi:predicted outer membrane repeat protein
MNTSPFPRSFFAVILAIGLVTWQPGGLRPASIPHLPAVCPASIQTLIDSIPNGGTINLPACTFTESLVIQNKSLTIIGDSSGNTIIQSAPNNRVIEFTGNYTLSLQNLVLSGGNAGANAGGGVDVPDGSLQITNCTIRNNSAVYGGGIFQGFNGGTLSISNSLIENNQAGQQGGGVFAKGTVTLTDTVFNSNSAGWHGGGLSNWEGDTTITRGSFSSNTASAGNGGAVNANNGLVVHGTQFSTNSAGDSGGAITQWNANFQIAISHATFQGNTAKNKGGGIFINSVLILDHDVFNTNIVNSGGAGNAYGGGVYAGNSGNVTAAPALVVTDSVFTGNKTMCAGCAIISGGGIYFGKSVLSNPLPTVLISGASFDANQSWYGGGAQIDYGSLTINHSSFTNNTAGYGGGLDAYQLDGEDLLFKGNQAVNEGGGLSGYNLSVEQSQFLDNAAGSAGGSALAATNIANLTNILAVDKTANPHGTLLLRSNASGTINNVTISRPAKGNGTAIYLVGNTNFHLVNTIITNYDKGLDVWGSLNYDHVLFFNNTSNIINESGSSVTNSGSNIQQDPLFANPGGDNYHLTASSPAIPGGLYTPGVTIDLDYRPRSAGRSAIGAYNFWQFVFIPIVRK